MTISRDDKEEDRCRDTGISLQPSSLGLEVVENLVTELASAIVVEKQRNTRTKNGSIDQTFDKPAEARKAPFHDYSPSRRIQLSTATKPSSDIRTTWVD